MRYEAQETDAEYDKRQHALYWARENKRAAAEEMYAAIRDLLDIGKRELSNPKYDGYFDALRAARDKAEGK